MIVLACDHAGFALKEKIKKHLMKSGYCDLLDVGAFKEDKDDDFSKYALIARRAFRENNDSKIIAFCGSGIGMNIALNKEKKIFCVCGHSEYEVKKAREHNNVNALSLGGRVVSFAKAKKMVDVFLNTSHLGGKYLKRMEEIDK